MTTPPRRAPLIETINREIEHWQLEEYEAEQRLLFARQQISNLVGAKTLRLVGGTDGREQLHGGDSDNPA